MTRFALARMPMEKQSDEVMYNNVDGRYIDGRADPFTDVSIRSLREVGLLDLIVSGKSVLDVGSGTGRLCNALSMLGDSEYFGVEPNRTAYELSTPQNVRVGFLNGYVTDIGELFDIVMSWHVVEHVDNPAEFVRQLFDRCKTGGIVIIATPNASSIFARSDKWRCMEPFHTYLLGKKMLDGIISESGGKVLKRMTWGGFPAPRSIAKELVNKVAKAFGHGDVQMVVSVKL